MPAANDLRKGMAILYNGDIAVVLDTQHRTPGNLRAFVQASIRSLKSGKSSDVRFSSTEKVEVVPMTTQKMEFSYKDGDDFVFSDPETYESVTLPPVQVGCESEAAATQTPVSRQRGSSHPSCNPSRTPAQNASPAPAMPAIYLAGRLREDRQ